MASGSDSAPTLRDHDGFIESLYHLLWVKNINGESCPEVRVPDVVIYKYRIPAYWYFTGSDGQLKRKNKTSIVNKKIYAEFTKGAKTPQDVVAYHISERVSADGDGSPETSITYFDSRTLHEFLFHQQKEDDGCLQKFVWPKGAHNSMIQAAWSPQICLLERRVNLHRLDSTRVPLQQRCCTYEGGEHLSEITPVRGTLLPDRVQTLCQAMTAHIRTTTPEHKQISRLLLNFKSDAQDNVWLLWASSVRIAPAAVDPSASSASFSAAGAPAGAPAFAETTAHTPVSPQKFSPAAERMTSAMASLGADGECPFSGRPLDKRHPYHLTYKAVIEHAARLARREEKADGDDEAGYEVPALLLTVAPELTLSQYLVEKTNPIFLFRRVLVAEETYLEFTQGVAAGTLPAALPLHRLFKDTPGYTSSAPSLAASSVSQLRGAA